MEQSVSWLVELVVARQKLLCLKGIQGLQGVPPHSGVLHGN